MMTLSIMDLMATLIIMTYSLMTLSISIECHYAYVSICRVPHFLIAMLSVVITSVVRCRDAQHNDIQHNYNKQNDNQRNNNYATLSIITLSIMTMLLCRVSFMLNVANKLRHIVILSAVMLSVVISSVVMLSVMLPHSRWFVKNIFDDQKGFKTGQG